ncbi:HK97 family phage prohead protease, partial [candidate division KSB1 bacterium]|nr:HK97 family phage prohead protease [Candidatus Saccharibacteria bacterium]NIR49578.1 HK97 family phage prohead protease [candidate division KSB1 bacterium]NIV71955.1 HK97 family phage prohead protease [Calditrichia bacterium]NIS25015.1 HK97 family phage prohead protease [candidate division KSB1 bacterium]NIU24109.1 HK97 family phage prohead protease [candidate division KSB1 bacterium]
VFNQLSHDLGGFREKIEKGAFHESLENPKHDVAALFNHDPNLILGRKSAKTLEMREDQKGLAVTIDPPDN